MKPFQILFVIAMAISSKAQATTPYEQLDELYIKASRAATLADIPSLDRDIAKARAQECFVAFDATPGKIVDADGKLVSADLITKVGSPGAGPLFPPIPDRVESLAFWTTPSLVTDTTPITRDVRIDWGSHVVNVATPSDYVVTQIGTYNQFVTSVRVNGTYLVFKSKSCSSADKGCLKPNEESRGYCYLK